MSIAKRNYVEEVIANTDDTTLTYYLSPVDYEEFYRDTRYGDACTVDLRFQSTTEAEAVFEHFNLVLGYENGIGEYIDINTPITDVAKEDFDETNTLELDADAVFFRYIEIWNYLNPNEEQIPTNITQEDYCANYADIAVKSYADYTQYKTSGDPNIDFANYIFNTLDLTDEDVTPFTYTTTRIFGDYIMFEFKVSQDELPLYSELSSEEQAEINAELVEETATDTNISIIMNNLYDEAGIEIFDPQLKLKYEFSTGTEYDNNGSETVVATVGDVEITADDLFAYMEERIGTFYTLELLKVDILVNSDLYTELYGESHDYMNSTNDLMVQHRADLLEMKTIFSSNGYSSYGYSSSSMTWNEFIYLAFSLETEEDILEQMFVVSELQFYNTIEDVNYASGVAYMEDLMENYFSLNVDHLLLYLDKDLDFQPDDYSDFLDTLDAAGQTEYNSLKVALENLITSKIAEGYTLDEIVAEYTSGVTETTVEGITTVTLGNEWTPFAEYGFYIMTESLGEIDHLSADSLDDNFAGALKRIYDTYSLEENNEETVWNDDRVITSDFGIHYISVTQGTNFDQYTAKFTSEDGELGDYSDGADNAEALPNQAQVELYILSLKEAHDDSTLPSVNLPTSVYNAVEYYFGPIYDSYMSQTGYSIAIGNQVLADGLTFTENNTENLDKVQTLIDVFYEVNFPELFDQDAE